MISRYSIFCKVMECGSFTEAAHQLGYSQSSVSQTIKALEQELGSTLIERKKDGILLTRDGEAYFPYLSSICAAEKALAKKTREMAGLENTTISIGTFASISQTVLPSLMKQFQERYPSVSFVLRQGEYTSIARWIQDGSVDFGFVNKEAVPEMEMKVLYEDEMKAILPPDHPLASKPEVSLRDLAQEPFLLLDEGDYSLPLTAFERHGLHPQVKYRVYDDYTILAMIRQGLGVSMIYERVLSGTEQGILMRPIQEAPRRVVALSWKQRDTMSRAARTFADYILKNYSTDFVV